MPSWPKEAAGLDADSAEDVVRDIALPMGLVGIEACAVDDTWSTLGCDGKVLRNGCFRAMVRQQPVGAGGSTPRRPLTDARRPLRSALPAPERPATYTPAP